jgi:multiple sugar transport system permease protein
MGSYNAEGHYEARGLLGERERREKGVRLLFAACYLGFGLLALAAVLPFAWMVLSSLRPAAEAFEFPARILPRTWDFTPYRLAFERVPFVRYLLNSLATALLAVFGQLALSAMAAYALSKLRPAGTRVLLFMMLATLMIPFETVAIPLYLQARAFPLGSGRLPHLNLLNTYWGLILPSLVSAFNVFVLKGYFDRIPADVVYAARIDGCSEWAIFRDIVLPLARPILVILGIFSFIGVWNGFFWPLIALNDPGMYTLMLGIQKMIEGGEPWNVVMAAVTITTIPTVLVFLALQKWILRGVAFTGLQG